MNSRDKGWLEEIAQSHSTPFGVLLPRVAQARYFELLDAFHSISPHVRIGYSVKTNPHPAILKALDGMESGFECTSLRELDAVSSFSRFLLFNAPCSTDEEIALALSRSAMIILDSLSQANQVSRIANGKMLDVGLRLRLDHHRFGFSPDDFPSLFSILESLKLRVTFLHAHPGTNCTLNQYRSFMEKVAGVLPLFPHITSIDIGGGIPGKTSLVERKESLHDYAKIVHEKIGKNVRDKTLILEPGRFLVEDSMILVARIQHLKQIDGTFFGILDAGINILPRISMSPYRFFPITESGEKRVSLRLAGPLLFGSDESGQVVGKLTQGDLVGVENIGAYCTELAWHLSRDAPPIIVVE
ncbi:MAG: alanine racemase [Candidatus Diapherotrites archaeon]